MPGMPDEAIFPRATAQAAETVSRHQSPQDLVFYSGWFCPFVQRTWIALEHKGIPYEYREVNPYSKAADFLEISPKGLVPALKFRGKPLHESLVIDEFLEDAYPDTKPLLPRDPYERALVRGAIDHVSKSIIPVFFRLLQAQDKEKQDKARSDLYEALRAYIKGIKGTFWAGDELTLADVTIAPFLVRLKVLEDHRGFVDSDVSQAFADYLKRIRELPEIVATTSEYKHYEEIMGRYLRDEAQSLAAKATRAGEAIP